MELHTTVNGQERTAHVAGPESAVEVIRGQMGLTGTKLVCGGGVCGACTITLDGEPVASCLLPATAMRDAAVTTVEGLGEDGELHPVQAAFLAQDALQCGYCTPGFVVDAAVFHDRWRAEHGTEEPSREVIADALAGHLCRCGAYEGIYRAVAAACRGDHDHGDVQVVRVDGPAKVTGAAVYTTDVRLPGMLHAAIRRSKVAAGTVDELFVPAGTWAVELLPPDRRIRWAGQPIAAVAAESWAAAKAAAEALPVRVQPRSFVLDPEAAKAADAPLVYGDREERRRAPNASEQPLLPATWEGNRRHTMRLPFRAGTARSRIAAARTAGAPGLVELDFTTTPQVHTSFEPHCAVADFSNPNRLRLWASTQGVDVLAREVAEHFDLDVTQVEVIAEHVGGGFGSKVGLKSEIVAAIELSRLTRRPVRLVLERREELTATGNRPGMSMSVSLLGDDDQLEALVLEAETSSGIAVGTIAAGLGVLTYGRSPRLAIDDDVVTNTPPGTPFRGPGGPVFAWALEQAIDEVAHRLGHDPIMLREHWDGNEGRLALYDWASRLDTWRQRPRTGSQSGRFRRGVGVAAANWLYLVDAQTEVEVGVEDGHLVVSTASQDMGTGSRTVLARAVADVFEVAPTEVEVRLGRAGAGTTHGPRSAGSRTTVSVWPAAADAALRLRRRIGGEVGPAHDGQSVTSRRGGDKGVRLVPVTIAGFQAGRGMSGAVHVTEVEVDTRTGKTRVLRVHGGIAVGRIHVPELARSQCEGAIIQGIGLALYEQQVLDPHTGLTLTSNLEDYRIPQLGDTPEIDIHFHQGGWEHVPGRGVGLGEVATISPAASIGNAIHNATGWRPRTLPVRPDRVLAGLARLASDESSSSDGWTSGDRRSSGHGRSSGDKPSAGDVPVAGEVPWSGDVPSTGDKPVAGGPGGEAGR